MSGGGDAPKSPGTRIAQAAVLILLFTLVYGATHIMPEQEGRAAAVAAVGFLLLAGTLMSELFEMIGLPHLSGQLAAGILAGPYVLKLIDHTTATKLNGINALALALIALEGGAELRLDGLKSGIKSLLWATLFQTVPIMIIVGAVFIVARPLMPFMGGLPLTTVLGAGLLWGVVAMTRSPSAALGILSQTRAHGPLARFTLNFVMASDIVVVSLMAVAIMIARPLVDPAQSFSFKEVQGLGYELLGSVSLGTTLGLVLAAYLRLVGKHLVLVYLALGFGATEIIKYLGFEALLTFMVAGFVVQNLSKQGETLLKSIGQSGSVIYVVFFATAGAELNIPLLRQLWPVALLFFGARALVTVGAARIASAISGDPPILRRWAWAGLVSQAGIALGIGNVIANAFPTFGDGFRAIVVACVALNEMIGPVLFKLALDRSGESSTAPRVSLASLTDEANAQ